MSSNSIYSEEIFYSYLLLDPDTLLPFYAGMGKNDRYLDHIKSARRSPEPKSGQHKLNRIRKLLREDKEPVYVFPTLDVPRDIARASEIALIKKYGRRDLGTGILTNQTDGGEGMRGWSCEHRKNQSKRQQGMIVSKDSGGNTYCVSKDDPRFLSGELVGINKGSDSIKNTMSKTMTGKTAVKDEHGNVFHVSKDDPRFLSGELVGIRRGMLGVVSHSTNIFIREPNTNELISTFSSAADAGRHYNHTHSCILQWAKKNTIRHGVLFSLE